MSSKLSQEHAGRKKWIENVLAESKDSIPKPGTAFSVVPLLGLVEGLSTSSQTPESWAPLSPYREMESNLDPLFTSYQPFSSIVSDTNFLHLDGALAIMAWTPQNPVTGYSLGYTFLWPLTFCPWLQSNLSFSQTLPKISPSLLAAVYMLRDKDQSITDQSNPSDFFFPYELP